MEFTLYFYILCNNPIQIISAPADDLLIILMTSPVQFCEENIRPTIITYGKHSTADFCTGEETKIKLNKCIQSKSSKWKKVYSLHFQQPFHLTFVKKRHIPSDLLQVAQVYCGPRPTPSWNPGMRGTAAYFSPNPRRCCPIRRTMSRSDWHISLTGSVPSPSSWSSPFEVAEHAPFIWEVEAWTCRSPVPPLCAAQPLLCMLLAETRCFFRGGDDTPPSSLSDDEARLAVLSPSPMPWSNPTTLLDDFKKQDESSTSRDKQNFFFIFLGDVTRAVLHRLTGNSVSTLYA